MIPKTIQTVENRKFPVEMDRKKTDLDSFRISHCRGRRRRPHSPWSPSRELWREEERDRGRRRRITTLWEAASCRLVRWWFPRRRKYDAFQSRGKGHSFCSSALLEFVRDGSIKYEEKWLYLFCDPRSKQLQLPEMCAWERLLIFFSGACFDVGVTWPCRFRLSWASRVVGKACDALGGLMKRRGPGWGDCRWGCRWEILN